jgi:hypothetical protein
VSRLLGDGGLARFKGFATQVCGPHAFDFIPVFLASMFIALGATTVAVSASEDPGIYTASAVLLSKAISVTFLVSVGNLILRVKSLSARTVLVITAYFVSSLVANAAMNLLLAAWNINPIERQLWQILFASLFATFIYLGANWSTHAIYENLYQVRTARNILDDLSGQRSELIRSVNEGRIFVARELSLEVQSTLGSIETIESKITVSGINSGELDQLKSSLSEVTVRVSALSQRFPDSTQQTKSNLNPRHTLRYFLESVTSENRYLPALMALLSLFGLGTWLGYLTDSTNILIWGSVLSLVGFVVFWLYLKILIPLIPRRMIMLRITVLEMLLLLYLFFWFVLIGFITGDNATAYGVALANSVIPFITFNAAVVLGGVLRTTQAQRSQLLAQAMELRAALKEIEELRKTEESLWKILFAGDIASSPTTASVMLRDVSLSGDQTRLAELLPNVVTIWSSVAQQLPSVGQTVSATSSKTSGRLEL